MASVTQNRNLIDGDHATRDAVGGSVTPRLLRANDAARYLGVSNKKIREWITGGRLPFIQLNPGNSPFLVDRRDLDRFIELLKVPAVRYE